MVQKKFIKIGVIAVAAVALIIGLSVGIVGRNQRRTTASFGKIADSTGLSMYENTCESAIMSSSSKAEKVSASSSKSDKASGVSSSKSNKESTTGVSSTKSDKTDTASVSSTKSDKSSATSVSSSKSDKGISESINCQPIYDKCTGPMMIIGSGKGSGKGGVSTSSSKSNKEGDFGSESIGTGKASKPEYESVSRAPSVDTMGCPTPRTASPVSPVVTPSPVTPSPTYEQEIITPPPTDVDTAAPTYGLEPIVTPPPTEVQIVTAMPSPSPTLLILETIEPTALPTSGSTPTVSKEVTGPPTLPLRGSA